MSVVPMACVESGDHSQSILKKYVVPQAEMRIDIMEQLRHELIIAPITRACSPHRRRVVLCSSCEADMFDAAAKTLMYGIERQLIPAFWDSPQGVRFNRCAAV